MESSTSPHTSSKAVTKTRVKKAKLRPDLTELLQFKVREPVSESIQVVARNQVAKQTRIFHSSDHHFILSPSADYEQYRLTLSVHWTSVLTVFQLTQSRPICPICLESNLVQSQVTECGHSYCMTCVTKLIEYQGKTAKCAICGKRLKSKDLKPVEFREVKRVMEGEEIIWKLMRKEKTGIAVYPCGEPVSNEICGFPDRKFRLFNRITYGSEEYITLLSIPNAGQINSEVDSPSPQETTLNPSSLVEPNPTFFVPEPAPDQNAYYYFFQEADGQPYFLHEITDKCLLAQYGKRSSYPLSITSRVLEVESVLLTPENLKEYRFLRHFSAGETVHFVELDVSSLCSQSVLVSFRSELDKREMNRRLRRRREEFAPELAQLLKEPLTTPLFLKSLN